MEKERSDVSSKSRQQLVVYIVVKKNKKGTKKKSVLASYCGESSPLKSELACINMWLSWFLANLVSEQGWEKQDGTHPTTKARSTKAKFASMHTILTKIMTKQQTIGESLESRTNRAR